VGGCGLWREEAFGVWGIDDWGRATMWERGGGRGVDAGVEQAVVN
jgi:hypothetical protein